MVATLERAHSDALRVHGAVGLASYEHLGLRTFFLHRVRVAATAYGTLNQLIAAGLELR